MAFVAAAGSCALGGRPDWMMPGARCGPSSGTTPAAAAALQSRSRCAARDRTKPECVRLPAFAHLRDVGVDHLPQNRQRHGSGPQQKIMESASKKICCLVPHAPSSARRESPSPRFYTHRPVPASRRSAQLRQAISQNRWLAGGSSARHASRYRRPGGEPGTARPKAVPSAPSDRRGTSRRTVPRPALSAATSMPWSRTGAICASRAR